MTTTLRDKLEIIGQRKSRFSWNAIRGYNTVIVYGVNEAKGLRAGDLTMKLF